VKTVQQISFGMKDRPTDSNATGKRPKKYKLEADKGRNALLG